MSKLGKYWVEVFFLAVLVTVGSALHWNNNARESDFKIAGKKVMRSMTQATSVNLRALIAERRLQVEVFVEDFQLQLLSITDNPDNEGLTDFLSNKIKRRFPGSFTFTTTNQVGKPLLDDIEGLVSEVCQADIKNFVDKSSSAPNTHPSDIYIHPQPFHYHYDIMVQWHSKSASRVFFVSFDAKPIADMLLGHEVPGYTLFLTRTDKPDLIEVSSEGVRDTLQREVSLSTEEIERIGHAVTVPGTRWRVIAIADPEDFALFHHRLLFQSAAILAVISLIGLVLLITYRRAENRRLVAVNKLHSVNQELEYRVAERTRWLRQAMEEIEQSRASILERADDLDRSNQELEQYAYLAAHDLQEPLRMVSSYLSLIKVDYSDKFDRKGLKFFDFAIDGATRMKTMITGLLRYSRVEANEEYFKLVSLRPVLDEVLQSLSLLVSDTDAIITVDLLPTVWGEPDQLSHLFQNLITNAIKFQKIDSQPKIHISAREAAGFWTISVEDNGIGIKPDYHERIFLVFQRLHARNEYSGSGLGLALCRKIVEQHDGRIWMESADSGGSIFYFTLEKIDPHLSAMSATPAVTT